MEKGKIIVLNGVSSSGKSSLANEITKLLPDFFAFSIDEYDYIIESMEDRENERLIPVETEYFYYHNVAMFADKGVNLILDQIIHDSITSKYFYELLNGYEILLVGVHCPADELSRREHDRGDRRIGLAQSQLNFVHQHEVYDVEVNTHHNSTSECAKQIVEHFKSLNTFTGFTKSLEKIRDMNSTIHK